MSSYTIRTAVPTDLAAIAPFTTDTFHWGDYVADQFLDWLEDDRGIVLVAVDSNDVPVAVARTLLLSPTEAWMHGARVHPEHRRQGVGRSLNDAGCAWAAQRGALVARLMVEDWNEAARRQVEQIGYHPVAPWMAGLLEMGSEVVPQTNGGRRVPGEERLTPGRATEADMAWMAWASSESARQARELFPIGWHFRRLRPEDLVAAATSRRLWHCPSGWVMVDIDDAGEMTIPWLSTTDLDAVRLVRAILDLADGSRVERARLMSPGLSWMRVALEHAGFVVTPSTIFARPL